MPPDFSGLTVTDQARDVFALAKDAANDLHHEYFGPEHILIGLLTLPAGAAASAFDEVGVDRGSIRSRIEAVCGTGNASSRHTELPYSEAGIRLLESAIAETRRSGVTRITTGHVLLAALDSRQALTQKAMQDADVDLSRLLDAARTHANDDEPAA